MPRSLKAAESTHVGDVYIQTTKLSLGAETCKGAPKQTFLFFLNLLDRISAEMFVNDNFCQRLWSWSHGVHGRRTSLFQPEKVQQIHRTTQRAFNPLDTE